VSGEN